jgi:hypothetical protein
VGRAGNQLTYTKSLTRPVPAVRIGMERGRRESFLIPLAHAARHFCRSAGVAQPAFETEKARCQTAKQRLPSLRHLLPAQTAGDLRQVIAEQEEADLRPYLQRVAKAGHPNGNFSGRRNVYSQTVPCEGYHLNCRLSANQPFRSRRCSFRPGRTPSQPA